MSRQSPFDGWAPTGQAPSGTGPFTIAIRPTRLEGFAAQRAFSSAEVHGLPPGPTMPVRAGASGPDPDGDVQGAGSRRARISTCGVHASDDGAEASMQALLITGLTRKN